jgi:UDP-2-acetamido-3-amino-2,3-dideoxy-glucuronate N-acetyltransferase
MAEFFVHELGLCETSSVGARTRIWAFAHVLAGARIGEDCNICDSVFIEGAASVGDRVTIKCGVQLWDGVALEDDVFVGPNVTFMNDDFPRSKQRRDRPVETVVRVGASIGANATILCGLEVGQGAMVGAGSVVTRSVPPHAIVVGNPAVIKVYVQTPAVAMVTLEPSEIQPGRTALPVRGAYVQRSPEFSDLRGRLTVSEIAEETFPFVPRRSFVVYGVPSREVRGAHAHRVCHQFLTCVAGNLVVAVDDGTSRTEIRLDSPTVGVYVPPLLWASEFQYSADAVLLVLASHSYDPDDYIRDYSEFLNEVGASSRTAAET